MKLISINRISNLVIGQGFFSANNFCKNSWNLNTELQTWDTGGAAGSEVETWILRNYDEKSVKISDQEKVSSNSILAWLLPLSAVSLCFVNVTKSCWEHFAMCLILSVWLFLSLSGDGSGLKVTFVVVRLQARPKDPCLTKMLQLHLPGYEPCKVSTTHISCKVL